jgi:hypothetical protein
MKNFLSNIDNWIISAIINFTVFPLYLWLVNHCLGGSNLHFFPDAIINTVIVYCGVTFLQSKGFMK